LPAHANRNTQCYTYSYAYANHDTVINRNSDSDDNPDCNDYAHSDTQPNAYTKSFSDATGAPDAGAKTAIPRVISGR